MMYEDDVSEQLRSCERLFSNKWREDETRTRVMTPLHVIEMWRAFYAIPGEEMRELMLDGAIGVANGQCRVDVYLFEMFADMMFRWGLLPAIYEQARGEVHWAGMPLGHTDKYKVEIVNRSKWWKPMEVREPILISRTWRLDFSYPGREIVRVDLFDGYTGEYICIVTPDYLMYREGEEAEWECGIGLPEWADFGKYEFGKIKEVVENCDEDRDYWVSGVQSEEMIRPMMMMGRNHSVTNCVVYLVPKLDQERFRNEDEGWGYYVENVFSSSKYTGCDESDGMWACASYKEILMDTVLNRMVNCRQMERLLTYQVGEYIENVKLDCRRPFGERMDLIWRTMRFFNEEMLRIRGFFGVIAFDCYELGEEEGNNGEKGKEEANELATSTSPNDYVKEQEEVDQDDVDAQLLEDWSVYLGECADRELDFHSSGEDDDMGNGEETEDGLTPWFDEDPRVGEDDVYELQTAGEEIISEEIIRVGNTHLGGRRRIRVPARMRQVPRRRDRLTRVRRPVRRYSP